MNHATTDAATLLSLAQEAQPAGMIDDSHTVAVPRADIEAALATPEPQPQAAASVVPPQVPDEEEAERGRPRFTDPTQPAQIAAITKRCKRHKYWTGQFFLPLTKKAALEYAKSLKSLGNPVNARIDNETTLVFWG